MKHRLHQTSNPSLFPTTSPAKQSNNSFVIPAPNEPLGKIEMFSPQLYVGYAAGGIFSGGLTYMTATPLDLVKCSMQIDPLRFLSISSGFGVLLKEQGIRGWVPTLLGCDAQGACKFGFYEFFKKYHSVIIGPEYATKSKTLVYLAGSSSTELIAGVNLCPMEAVKVRVLTAWFCQGFGSWTSKVYQI